MLLLFIIDIYYILPNVPHPMKNIDNALITIIDTAITITDTTAIPTTGIMQSSKMFSFLCNIII